MTTEALEVVTPDKKPIENRYAYTGRELENETGLYYYRARYYDPELGRFISEDPIGFSGGDVNLFRYVENDPINRVDPSGLDFRICSRPLNMSLPNAEPFKHYFIRMDDGSTISYGVDEKGNPSELQEGPPSKEEKCGGNIESTKKENQMMKDWANKHYSDPYSPFGHNCKSFVGEVTTQPWRNPKGR